MKKIAALAIVLASTLAVLANAARGDEPRTLIYHFRVQKAGTEATGTVTVMLQAPGTGGRQVADVTEALDGAPTPPPPLHCTIDGVTTAIDCVPIAEATDEELSLLEFLGASFYSPSRLDSHHHWHISTVVERNELRSDFTLAKSEGSVLTLTVASRSRIIADDVNRGETGTIQYNATLKIPESIRLRDFSWSGSWGEEQALDLVSDSMARAASPNPH